MKKVKQMSEAESLAIYKQLASLALPSGILDHFDVDEIEFVPVKEGEAFGLESGTLRIHLLEHDEYLGAEEGHSYRPNGFFPTSVVNDFPLRDRKVTLVVHRRRWLDVSTHESVCNTHKLCAEGTRHSVELAAFLKDDAGYLSDIGLVASEALSD